MDCVSNGIHKQKTFSQITLRYGRVGSTSAHSTVLPESPKLHKRSAINTPIQKTLCWPSGSKVSQTIKLVVDSSLKCEFCFVWYSKRYYQGLLLNRFGQGLRNIKDLWQGEFKCVIYKMRLVRTHVALSKNFRNMYRIG